MKSRFGLLATLCACGLMACTPFSLVRTRPPQQSNALAVLAPTVETLYAFGSSEYGAGRLAKAEHYFGQVLVQQPAHPAALNALAVLYAQTGRAAQAVALFRQAIALDPKAAYVHNNLGYTLLCMGDYEQAHSELAMAFELNPSSVQTRENIERLSREFSRAAKDVSANTPVSRLVPVAPNIFVFQESPGELSTSSPKSAPDLAQRVATLDGVRIEVSNGVGIRNLAKITATRLSNLGAMPVRLTNQPNFRQVKTEIQFRSGLGEKAAALSANLPLSVNQAASSKLRSDVQVRLVLGNDPAGNAIALWLQQGSDVRLASVASQL